MEGDWKISFVGGERERGQYVDKFSNLKILNLKSDLKLLLSGGITPLIVGSFGLGKSATVYSLARELAKEKGRKVYHLNIGQPDIKTPEIALEAIKKADLKVVEYTHSAGNISFL